MPLELISLPPGLSFPYCGTSAPTGWLLEDGSAVSRTTYAALFAVVGTTFGPGDGSTTFNLPDSRGRAPIGAGTGSGLTARALGATGGEEIHMLSSGEMPVHNHGVSDPGHKHSIDATTFSGGGASFVTEGTPAGSTDANAIFANTTGISIQNAGAGNAHNNMQPWIAKNWIIKT